MIRASSLFYSIVISLIIAIISSSLILFSYLSHIQFENFEINQRLNLNADSGINLLLSKQSVIQLNETILLDLYNEGIDSVELSRKSWGANEIIISKAIFKNKKVERIAEVGFYPDTTNRYSLYLADEGKPLALCGKTIINGDAYLPKSGVKRAYIEGQNFIGNQLINGKIKISNNALPEFNKDLTDKIQHVFTTKTFANNDSIVYIKSELAADTITNSFNKPTIVYTSQDQIIISTGFYSGNIAFISGQKIIINSNVIINDAIICAPKVVLQEGFKGNVQVFASDSIFISKNVSLKYPSVIGILPNNSSPQISCILTNENDSISGCLFACKNKTGISKQTGIIIKNKAVINGQVYSNGYVDVQGIINGSVMSNEIILNTPSSVYENHLLNATIDLTSLSKFYVGINLVEESKVKKVIKWLN